MNLHSNKNFKDFNTMDNGEKLIQLLAEIKRELQQEAERTKNRWMWLTTFLVVVLVVAMPAIWSYIHHLLVIWF